MFQNFPYFMYKKTNEHFEQGNNNGTKNCGHFNILK